MSGRPAKARGRACRYVRVINTLNFRACRVIFITRVERLTIWNYWLVSREMSVVFGTISI